MERQLETVEDAFTDGLHVLRNEDPTGHLE